MKRLLSYFLLLALVCSAAVSCSHREARIIPRDKMTRIITDMLIADQWLIVVGDEGYASDRTLFYEPVFNKYGYTSADYLESVHYYLKDPNRFSKMVKKASAKISSTKKAFDEETQVFPKKEKSDLTLDIEMEDR